MLNSTHRLSCQVHLSTNVPFLSQQDWPSTTSQEDINDVQSGLDEVTPTKRSSSSCEEGKEADSSTKKRKVDETLNITNSTLNEDVTMNSDDFMNTSIDANISINSEDYENYIRGEDFKPSDKCSDLELSGLNLDPGSGDREEPLEQNASVDDILAKYSHLQSPLETSDTVAIVASVELKEKQKPAKAKPKQVPLKATDKDSPSLVKPNVVESINHPSPTPKTTKPETPSSSKSVKERKTKTPRPKKEQANNKNSLSHINQTTPTRKVSPNLNPKEGERESSPINSNGKGQEPKGGKTPSQSLKKAIFKSEQNKSVVGASKVSSSPKTVKSQPNVSATASPASGKKPAQQFKCDECDKTLSNKYNLTKHKLIHDKRRASGAT